MEPTSPELRARILRSDPSLEPELDEYERLLAQRQNQDPDTSNPERDLRIAELGIKLNPLVVLFNTLTSSEKELLEYAVEKDKG